MKKSSEPRGAGHDATRQELAMVEDASVLAATATEALVAAASSADRWAEIRNDLHSYFLGSSPALDIARIRQFHNEIEGLAYAASGWDTLDSPSREYIYKRFMTGVRELLQSESPDITEHIRSIALIAGRLADRDAAAQAPVVRLRLGRSSDPGTGLQINVDSSPPENAEGPPDEPAVRAPRSVLLANMRMEFYGDRTLAALTPARLGLDPIENWRPALLAQRIVPPVELLPARIYGRDDLLAELQRLLENPDGQCHALTGPLGAGKSTIALELARRALAAGLNVWWIPGSADIVDGCMIAVAGQLEADPGELAAARAGKRSLQDLVWRYLNNTAKPWLLIFDGVDDKDLMSTLSGDGQGCGWIRPSRRGLVLVSSCLTEVIARQRHTIPYPVRPMDRDDVLKFLEDAGIPSAGARKKDWETLACRLSGAPFTLNLIARYLVATVETEEPADGGTPAHADELANRLAEIDLDGKTDPADEVLRAVFKWLSTSGSLDALLLLGLISYYDPNAPFPVGLLDQGVLVEAGTLGAPGPGHRKVTAVSSALQALRALGLVEIKGGLKRKLETAQSLHVHPLISHRWRELLKAQSPSQLSRAGVGAAKILASAAGRQSSDAEGYEGWHFLIPHLNALLGNLSGRSPADAIENAVRAAAGAVSYLARTGAYRSATRIGRAATSLGANLGEGNPARLEMETVFAKALALRGSIGEAHRILAGVLDVKQRTLGLEDPASLDTLEVIALLLHRQGRLSRAELALRQVLKGRQRQGDGDTAALVQPMSDLARVLRERGKLGDAERFARQVWRTRRQFSAADSAEFFQSAIDLAIVLLSLGKLAEAETILRDVLKAREHLLGPEHRDTIDASVALAQVLRARGRLTEAETMLREAVRLRRLILGLEHRDTIDAQAALAHVRRDEGWLADAEQLLRDVLKARRRLLGADHPEYLNAMLGLGVILNDTGRLYEAEAILRELIGTCDPAVPENPTLLSARHNLAAVLQNKGMLEESERHYREVLSVREWSLGSNHPETLSTLANLGSLLRLKGMLTEARHMLEQAGAAYAELLGERHPFTLTVRTNIASVYVDMGRPREAAQAYWEIVRAQKAVLGYSHPDTLLTRVNLAVALGECREFASAEVLLKAAVRSYGGMFEMTHPSLLTARYQLARIMERDGKLTAALVEYQGVADSMTSALGESHVETIAAQLGASRVLQALGRTDESHREYVHAIQVAASSNIQRCGLRRSAIGRDQNLTRRTAVILDDPVINMDRPVGTR
jgi:tetratricopeptide (TPR) repeat protein